MKKKDLYKIIKEVVKEQLRGDGSAVATEVPNEPQAEVPALSDPIVGDEPIGSEVDVNEPVESVPSSTINWSACVSAGPHANHAYNNITFHSDNCGAVTPVTVSDGWICCSSTNTGGTQSSDPATTSGTLYDVNTGTIAAIPTLPNSISVLAFNNNSCFCPNPVMDASGDDHYNYNGSGAYTINPNFDADVLIACNAVVVKPWEDPSCTGPGSGACWTSQATITYLGGFAQADFTDWLSVNGINAQPTLVNDGRRCAGCNDPAAENYQIDDTGATGNSNIYGCAAGSVNGISSEDYTNIQNQGANDVGCCQYQGCMQYGATLTGQMSLTNAFASNQSNASAPSTNMNTGTPQQGNPVGGTQRGAAGRWFEDGSCVWEGCTYTAANNVGTISGQNTTLYPPSLFTNGANTQFLEDGNCTGTYGCTESVGSPNFATGAAPFGGGNDFPPATGDMICAGCPDPAAYNTYTTTNAASAAVNLSGGFPKYDCAGNLVANPGTMTGAEDVSCCTATAAGCMDDGTNPTAYEAGGTNANPNEARPTGWDPDGSGNTAPACNYDPNANQEDNSCIYADCVGCTDANFVLPAGAPHFAVSPVIDSTAYNYIYDNGSCFFDGCVESEITPVGYTVPVTTTNYVCIVASNLCGGGNTPTYPAAQLYDSTAPNPPGFCTVAITGCTDTSACNYDPMATTNDQQSCVHPEVCEICEEGTAGSEQYGANNELTGNVIYDTDCDCISVVAYRCNREDITKSFGCMTIGGNDPAVGDVFIEPQKKIKENITLPLDENGKLINEQKALIKDKLGTVYVVESIVQASSQFVRNYIESTCNPTNWKCYCPSTGRYGANMGQPSTSHPHVCVPTQKPLGVPGASGWPSPPVFATWSECHNTYGCRYEPGARLQSQEDGREERGECHMTKSGALKCDKVTKKDLEKGTGIYGDTDKVAPEDRKNLPPEFKKLLQGDLPNLDLLDPMMPFNPFTGQPDPNFNPNDYTPDGRLKSDVPITEVEESKNLRKALKKTILNLKNKKNKK